MISDSTAAETLLHTRMRASPRRVLWLGIALTIVGIVAIVFPVISTIAASLFVGWMLLLAGIFLFVGSFTIHGTGPFFGSLLIALLTFAAGVFLLVNPLAGAVALTIVLGVVFLVQGAFELTLAFEMRPHRAWMWMALSGFASVILGLVIAVGLSAISLIALGIVIGINFLTTGLSYIFASQMAG
jgi:uncharacterized membrane protein HdeD (DUF308 family)